MMFSTVLMQISNTHVDFVDPDSRILLFGSRARGESQTNSDWDFLILSERKVDRDFKNQITDSLYEVELETEEVLTGKVQNDLVWNDFRLTSFYQNVLKDGIEI